MLYKNKCQIHKGRGYFLEDFTKIVGYFPEELQCLAEDSEIQRLSWSSKCWTLQTKSTEDL